MGPDRGLDRASIATAEGHDHGQTALLQPREHASVALAEPGVGHAKAPESIGMQGVDAGLVEHEIRRVRLNAAVPFP